MTVPCKRESCDREFDNIRGMHTHYGKVHGDPHADGRSVRVDGRELIDAHPQMETIDAVFITDGHIRLYRWFESHERETIKEYRIGKFRDRSQIQGSEWMSVPTDHIDPLIDMLLEVDLDGM